uniref:IMD domain-containing protein n=1 Tax=Globodera pallida TaxID=36090 RepID=A0A183CH63_GLOPA
MNSHIGTFSSSMSQTELCSSAEKLERNVRSELNQTSGCRNGGGQSLLGSINDQLATSEGCERSLGFARAMFDLAAAAADHGGNNNAWSTLFEQFNNQITVIDKNCDKLEMRIVKVNFTSPRGGSAAHRRVPGPDTVIANPGESGSHNKI